MFSFNIVQSILYLPKFCTESVLEMNSLSKSSWNSNTISWAYQIILDNDGNPWSVKKIPTVSNNAKCTYNIPFIFYHNYSTIPLQNTS